MFPRGGQERLALDDIHADWFLEIDIGPSLHRSDAVERVPVVRRTDEDNVQVLFGEHGAVVAIGARSFLRLLPLRDQLGGAGQHALVRIAERNHLHRGDLDQAAKVTLAIPAGSDQADAERLLLSGAKVQTLKRGSRCRQEAGFEKRTPVERAAQGSVVVIAQSVHAVSCCVFVCLSRSQHKIRSSMHLSI